MASTTASVGVRRALQLSAVGLTRHGLPAARTRAAVRWSAPTGVDASYDTHLGTEVAMLIEASASALAEPGGTVPIEEHPHFMR